MGQASSSRRYTEVSELGSGAFGSVYLVEHAEVASELDHKQNSNDEEIKREQHEESKTTLYAMKKIKLQLKYTKQDIEDIQREVR